MKIREMVEGDKNFILSTWLKSFYDAVKMYGSRGSPYVSADVFFLEHQNKIKDSLEKHKCLVCTAPDDDNQIIGYIVFSSDCLHYCYVKNVYRKLGVSKQLISKCGNLKQFSHHTRFTKHIANDLVYNPYKF